MKKHMKTVILLLFLAIIHTFSAQTITITNATKQSWAGGICCATGTNYQISLKVSGIEKKFKLDTLWIGQKWFELSEQNSSLVKSERNGEVYYTINAGISENRYYKSIDIEEKIVPVKTVFSPAYTGAACIQYRDNNRQKQLLSIKEFKELDFLAYP